VAAAAAGLIGAAGWVVGQTSTHRPAVADTNLITAELIAHQHPVGQVVVSTSDELWISMAVDTGLAHQTVMCQLLDQHGETITLGSFTLTAGYGYWASPIRAPSSPITTAQIVDTAGHVLATATMRRSNR